MNAEEMLSGVVAGGRTSRAVGGGVYSALAGGAEGRRHDRRAAVYDAVVGTNVYNRVMWGASRGDYEAFARGAFAAALVSKLGGLLKPGGRLFLTSLVRGGRPAGDNWLRLLHGAGEFVRPRSGDEVRGLLEGALGPEAGCETRGNMAYAAAAVRRAGRA